MSKTAIFVRSMWIDGTSRASMTELHSSLSNTPTPYPPKKDATQTTAKGLLGWEFYNPWDTMIFLYLVSSGIWFSNLYLLVLIVR